MRKLAALRNVFTAPLALLLVGSLFGLGACSGEDGTTPTCTQDVSESGNQVIETGCNQFAGCFENPSDPNSKLLPPEECCKDPQGEPLVGQQLALCLYGFGVKPPNSSGGTGSGGTGGDNGAGGGNGAGGAGGGS